MTELDASGADLLARFAEGEESLQQTLQGLTSGQLDLELPPNGWTIREIIHHLADGEPIWAVCIRSAVGAPGAVMQLGWYPGNEQWGARLSWRERPIEPAMDLLSAHRRDSAQLLVYRPDAWDQVITFAGQEPGQESRLTVREAVAILVEHLDEHLAEIRAIRQHHQV